MHAFGAVFVEVHVDPDLGLARVLNRKTAHNSWWAASSGGRGMGLMEKTEMARRMGRAVNAIYHATDKLLA